MDNSSDPTILVIVGITGDLAKRKLLPAIERIAAAGELPDKFHIIGVSRRQVEADDVIATLPSSGGKNYPFIRNHLSMRTMNLEARHDYDILHTHINKLENDWSVQAQRLFYLSVPPQISHPIIRLLGEAGFARDNGMKLLMEKPFGSDYVSAQDLVDHIRRYFSEEQVYRIDHYLAKEMAQNIIVFRNGNSLFKQTWNTEFIERIEIIATESIGIEGRGVFYEQTGALRDVLQNHLLQLAALTLMELPDKNVRNDIPDKRLAALRQLHAASPDILDRYSFRAQYEGYDDEAKNPHSTTETFASVTLFSTDPAWKNVPITLTTGKALRSKCTEVRIYYRKQSDSEANRLSLRLQPKEGIEFDVWSKSPGYDRQLAPVKMQFNYHEQAEYLPEAYEQVFLDAINSNHTLFASSDEVLEAWRILDPVQHAWNMSQEPLRTYKQGSSPDEVTGGSATG